MYLDLASKSVYELRGDKSGFFVTQNAFKFNLLALILSLVRQLIIW